MYDFIKSSAVLENVKIGSGFIECRCPACALMGEDSTHKNHLRIYPNGAFICFKYQETEHNKLIRSLLRDENVPEGLCYDPEPTVNMNTVYAPDILDRLLKDYSYWEKRGIGMDVVEKLNGGVAKDGESSKLSGRAIFPCYDKNEQIVGFAGRLIDPDKSFAPRWKILGAKKHFIFPRHSISSAAIKSSDSVILVEGIGCVLKLASCGHWNTLCLFGLKLSSTLVGHLIALNPSRIIIATNNEASGIGNIAAQKIRSKLLFLWDEDRIIIKLPTKKDFMDMSDQEVYQWLSELENGH